MIDAKEAIQAVRAELRETVLPELHDEHVRSVVIGMLGILGDLAGHVRLDDTWCGVSAEELLGVAARWLASLDDATEVSEYLTDVERGTPRDSRERALAAVEALVVGVWNAKETDPHLLGEVRASLAADLSRQLEHGR